MEDDRTFLIMEDDRTLLIMEDDRTLLIMKDDRTLLVMEDDRTLLVMEDDRTLLISLTVIPLEYKIIIKFVLHDDGHSHHIFILMSYRRAHHSQLCVCPPCR